MKNAEEVFKAVEVFLQRLKEWADTEPNGSGWLAVERADICEGLDAVRESGLLTSREALRDAYAAGLERGRLTSNIAVLDGEAFNRWLKEREIHE